VREHRVAARDARRDAFDPSARDESRARLVKQRPSVRRAVRRREPHRQARGVLKPHALDREHRAAADVRGGGEQGRRPWRGGNAAVPVRVPRARAALRGGVEAGRAHAARREARRQDRERERGGRAGGAETAHRGLSEDAEGELLSEATTTRLFLERPQVRVAAENT
jgi:hypothetical protein